MSEFYVNCSRDFLLLLLNEFVKSRKQLYVMYLLEINIEVHVGEIDFYTVAF